jgi:rhodanese-related sulfurtransferase
MRLCSSPPPADPAADHSQQQGESLRLPHFSSLKDAIKRISPSTLADVLHGRHPHLLQDLLIIDCRYPYEYAGGHLPGAVNVNSPDGIDRLLRLDDPKASRPRVIVFHCEFSSQRAPRMALHVRNCDRLLNAHRYPHLYFPEMYILDGGYKAFYELFSVQEVTGHVHKY